MFTYVSQKSLEAFSIIDTTSAEIIIDIFSNTITFICHSLSSTFGSRLFILLLNNKAKFFLRYYFRNLLHELI